MRPISSSTTDSSLPRRDTSTGWGRFTGMRRPSSRIARAANWRCRCVWPICRDDSFGGDVLPTVHAQARPCPPHPLVLPRICDGPGGSGGVASRSHGTRRRPYAGPHQATDSRGRVTALIGASLGRSRLAGLIVPFGGRGAHAARLVRLRRWPIDRPGAHRRDPGTLPRPSPLGKWPMDRPGDSVPAWTCCRIRPTCRQWPMDRPGGTVGPGTLPRPSPLGKWPMDRPGAHRRDPGTLPRPSPLGKWPMDRPGAHRRDPGTLPRPSPLGKWPMDRPGDFVPAWTCCRDRPTCRQWSIDRPGAHRVRRAR